MPKVKVKVSKDGIQFGECFINHDAILDGRGPIVKANYLKWMAEALKPCKHHIGTDSFGHDICEYCGEHWEDRDDAMGAAKE